MAIVPPHTHPRHEHSQYADAEFAMPVGAIIAYGGATPPSGWALCDGSAHGSAALQAVTGSANTPDLRGRFILGTSAGHPTGQTGGAETHTLTIAEMPVHSHQWAAAGVTTPSATPANWDDSVAGDTAALGTGPADPEYGANAIKTRGGGGAHNNMPPYYALTYIIKT